MNGYWGSKSSVVNAPDSLFLFRYPPFFRLHQFVGDRNHGPFLLSREKYFQAYSFSGGAALVTDKYNWVFFISINMRIKRSDSGSCKLASMALSSTFPVRILQSVSGVVRATGMWASAVYEPEVHHRKWLCESNHHLFYTIS